MKRLSIALLFLSLSLPLLGTRADDKKPADRGPVKLTDEAVKVHREALVIDGHNDLPWQFREKNDLSFQKIDLPKPQKALHTDIPRLRQGGGGAQFWSAFGPAESRKKGTAVRESRARIDAIPRRLAA